MPFNRDAVGSIPKESPIRIKASLPWTIFVLLYLLICLIRNFAAACTGGLELNPAYFDNRKGQVPEVHPAFLPSCNELVGMFATVYNTGYTREEMTKYTLAHYTCDIIFHKGSKLRANDDVETAFSLISATQKRSGISLITKFNHKKGDGSPIAEGYFGGVLLGAKMKGEDNVLAAVPERPIRPEKVSWSQSIKLVLPSNAAHVWDSCIRDPRNPKAKSSDINVHTNLDFAEKAGFKSRTFTGLCLLANVLTLLKNEFNNENIESSAYSTLTLHRYGCRFSNPVFVLFNSVPLTINFTHAHDGDELVVFFQVDQEQGQGGAAIKDGYMVFRRDPAPKTQTSTKSSL